MSSELKTVLCRLGRGGVINPVTGRWAVKSWKIEALLPEADRSYRAIEAKLGIAIYHPIPLRRFCQNEADLKRIGRRSRNPRYADVLGALCPPGKAPEALRDPCGSFEIYGAAYVDLPPLLEAMRTDLKTAKCYREGSFEHHALKQGSDGNWQYGDVVAKQIVFCEGAAVTQTHSFKLAHEARQGETLAFSCPELQLPHSIYHNGKWLLPYGNNRFRIGATYDEADHSEQPTAAAKDALLKGLAEILKEVPPLKIEAHLAGLRPSTVDARPIMGQHPKNKGLYLFNGLGSRAPPSRR